MTELDLTKSESESILARIIELAAENDQLRGSPVLSENGAAILAELFNDRWRTSFTKLEAEVARLKAALKRAPCEKPSWPMVENPDGSRHAQVKYCGICEPCLARKEKS